MVDIGNISHHSERHYLKNQNIGVLVYYILSAGKTLLNMCVGERFNWWEKFQLHEDNIICFRVCKSFEEPLCLQRSKSDCEAADTIMIPGKCLKALPLFSGPACTCPENTSTDHFSATSNHPIKCGFGLYFVFKGILKKINWLSFGVIVIGWQIMASR